MRYLKKKVCLYPIHDEDNLFHDRAALNNLQDKQVSSPPFSDFTDSCSSSSVQETPGRTISRRASIMSTSSKPEKEGKGANTKTIVKNFGKAMCSFASSELALPYLNQLVNKSENIIKPFQTYIKKKKGTVDCIEALRSLLLPYGNDSKELTRYKQIFKELSIVFIKYFSVNWIFQGKMAHKQVHLKARYKMLRRVQNPEYFTYFKGFVKETKTKNF